MRNWMKHGWRVGLMGCMLGAGVSDAQIVVRRIDQPPLAAWESGAWNSARIELSEQATDLPSGEAALRVKAAFSGKGFEFFGVSLINTSMPGRLQKVSLQAKGGLEGRTISLAFRDAKGRNEVNGRKLEYGIKATPAKWTAINFSIPPEWEQPVQFVGLSGHNWGAKTEEATAEWLIQGVTVETDLNGQTDPGKLFRASITSSGFRNVFVDGDPVRFSINMDNWIGHPVTGELKGAMTDFSGQVVTQFARTVTCDDMVSSPVDFHLPAYGLYRIRLDLDIAGRSIQEASQLAFVPSPQKLSLEQKMTSPYGINIHGGGTPGYKALARVGVVWIRDYAYTWSWLTRARGDNGRYEGWPWYPRMDKAVQDAGLMLLPCLQDSMKGTVGKGGPLSPDPEWRRQLVDVLRAFPQYVAWEIDNEYDLHNRAAEESRNWSSYLNYHRVFAQGLKFMNEKVLTVEQGAAGIYPDRTRKMIASGALDQIDVINGHFYCGTDAPELSVRNANTGGDKDAPASIYDLLREQVGAADSDGHNRQVWITEFGWDTLAGHIVSEAEQAAFLQRGWLLGLQAGLDRMFWYWELDTKSPPKVFFDGCGIFNPKNEPKPAAAALAGMAHLLPQPKPVGTFDVGSNTMGHVFLNGNQLVAALFQLESRAPAPVVKLPKGSAFDLFANPVTAREVALGLAPVWLVGLEKNTPWYRQTAFDLITPGYQRVTAGDTVDVALRVRGNRDEAVSASYRVEAPAGLTLDVPQGKVSAEPGVTNVTTLHLNIAASLPGGTYRVTLFCREGESEKMLPMTLEVGKAAGLKVTPLPVTPGASTVRASVYNASRRTLSFNVAAVVPASWQVSPQEIMVRDLPGGASTDVLFNVTWQPGWKESERAFVQVRGADGDLLAEHGLMPGSIRIPRLSGLKMDGNLKDWPAGARWAEWALGSTRGAPKADVYLGYSDAGLHVALRVQDAPATVTDPTWFWAADSLELFVDTKNDKQPRNAYAATDHQFWICPIVASNKVYAGRWKRNAEIAATEYDLQDVQGYSRREGTGYVMEFTIPPARIKGWTGKSGDKLGLNLNLNVTSGEGQREIFWLVPKAEKSADDPARWGVVQLE